ncbi:site-specific DNA-methyltransferase [Limosilactobacillus balticus]|uniref:site-specific DNA-methyltransferase n=1 Tax=Limosilactobacillus balticus TaxID=2759747 RepID=UPI003994952C
MGGGSRLTSDCYFSASTPNFKTEAANKLAELFPEVVADGQIDVDALEELLSPDLEDVETSERYEFTWRGKKNAKRIADTPARNTTLVPNKAKSKEWNDTKNIFIEGDNLEVLKLLQKAYSGKVKMIYIDPPYNTGHDFIYKDNYHDTYQNYLKETGQLDEEGNSTTTNKESNGRFHTDWLNMMYPRLKLARNLLTNDGVIFVSIDQNEANNLIDIMNEIFSERNFMGQISVVSNPRGRSQDKYIATSSEYLLIYSKNILSSGRLSVDKKEDDLGRDYKFHDENGLFRILELRNTHRDFGKNNRPNLYYPLYVSDEGKVSLSQNDVFSNEVFPIWNDGFEGCWTWGKEKTQTNIKMLVAKKVGNDWKIYRKSYAQNSTKQLKSIWDNKDFYTDKGQATIFDLFKTKEKIFQAPKSVAYIKQIINMGSNNNDDIILDFFSGSGTTAQAVMELNAELGSNLKYILVQLPEKTSQKSVAYKDGYKIITDIAEERIRRVGKKIQVEHPNAKLDTGFKVFKLGKSTIKQWDENPENFEKQLELIHSPFTQESTNDQRALEISLKSGINLEILPKIAGDDYHFVADDKEVFVILGNYDETLLNKLNEKRKLQNATVILREMSGGSEVKFNLLEKVKQEAELNNHFSLEWV